MRTPRTFVVRRAPRTRRAIVLAAGAALSLCAADRACAQYIWIAGAAGTQNFTDTTKWLNGSAPGSNGSATTTLTFSPGNNAASTATNNNSTPIATPFLVNAMTFNGMSVPNGFTVAGAANNVFQLAGTIPTLTLQGMANSTISNVGAALQLAANTTITGPGLGALNIFSVISETGGARSLTISNTPSVLGMGTVNLVGLNTFTGGIILNGGTVGHTASSGVGAYGPANSTLTVTGSGGVMNLGGTGASFNLKTMQIDPGATLKMIGGGGFTFGNSVDAVTGNSTFNTKLAGSGNLLITAGPSATAVRVLSDSSAYTGVVTIDRSEAPNINGVAGALQLAAGSSTGTIGFRPTENGNLLGVDTFNIRNGGQLTMTNATLNQAQSLNRVKDTAVVNLASGQLNLVGCATTTVGPGSVGNTAATPVVDSTETVGAVNGAGFSFITVQPGANLTSSSTLTIASLNRDDRGDFLVRGLNLGNGTGSANAGNLVVTAAPSGLVGGGGSGAAATNISILPYVIAGTTNTDNGSTFATLSGTNSVIPLTTAQYAVALGTALDNVRLTAATANNIAQTTNSLILATNGANHGSVTGTGTLTLTSGALLATTTSPATGAPIDNNITFPTGVEGHVYSSGAGTGGLRITGLLTGDAGFTKSGGNPLFLTNTGNAANLTGTLTLNAGALDVSNPGALPGTGTIVTNGAAVGNDTSGISTALIYSGSSTMDLTRDVAANSGWMKFRSGPASTTATTNPPSVLKLSGVISGAAGVAYQAYNQADIPGGGFNSELWITGTSNTYTGPSRITGGVVHIAGDGSLGNGGALGIASVLKLEGDWTTSRHINNEGMTIDTNGFNATLSGPMTNSTGGSFGNTGVNAVFNKNGAGTLILNSNDMALGGPLNVNAGTVRINGTLGGSPTHPITVAANATLGGSGTVWRNISVATGGILAPGNSAGVLTEYGNLGLANGSAFAIELNGVTLGTQYDQMAVNGTVTLTTPTLSIALGYTPALGDLFFIITNDGADAVTGTFNGLPNGATFTVGSTMFAISYEADSANGTLSNGNDVALSVVPTPGAAGLLGLGTLLTVRRRRR